MRIKTLLAVSVVLLFAMTLMSSSSWATTVKNCPAEPAQGVPIKSGDTYYGSNCALYTASDVDSFQFKAAAGDTWIMETSSTKIGYPNNICLTLNDPSGKTIFFGCTDTYHGRQGEGDAQQLQVAGDYTIVLTETTNTETNYELSLERVSPAPPDGVPLVLGKVLDGAIDPPSALNAFTIYGDTLGKYQVSASMTSGGYPANLCFNVYQPNGTAVVNVACTDTYHGVTTVQEDFVPPDNGTYVVLVYEYNEIYTFNYNLSVSCVSGQCKKQPPKCELTDSLTYSSGTLTMNFTVGTPVVVTWNGWLTVGNTMTSLFSKQLPITEPPTKEQVTQTLAPSGVVGVLSTFTTTKNGITCSNWAAINTGSAKSK